MLLDYLLVFLAAFAWSFSFVTQKVLIQNLSPIAIVFFRCGTACLVILSAIIITRTPLSPKKHHHKLMPVVGFISYTAPFLLIASAVLVLPSGIIGILQATSGLSTLLLAHILTEDERMTWLKFVTFLLGTIGLILLFHGQNTQLEQTLTHTPAEPILWVVLAVISYSISAISSKQFSQAPSLITTFYTLLWACLWVLPLIIIDVWIYNHPLIVDTRTTAAAVFMGSVLTALPFFLRQIVINRQSASFFSMVGFLIPPLSLINGWLFLGEVITLETLEAMGFILAALALSKQAFRHS